MRHWVLGCVFATAACAGDVTFYRDVLPVLQQRCQECHRPGEAAPMPLVTYKDARPWAKAIREAVLSKKMPPWFADPAHGKFSNDRSLPEREKRMLAAWADSGAPEGDPGDGPKPLVFTDGWSIGKPDLVLELPVEHKLPASGTIDYTYFAVPTGLTEDKWIEKVEVRPGNRAVVHHVVLFARPPGSRFMASVKSGAPFAPPRQDEPHGTDTGQGMLYALNGSAEMISVYVPGGIAYRTRAGQARLMKAGSDLIFQMHYTANGKAATDRSRVGIVFAKQPPKERVINTFIFNPMLHIPAGESNFRAVAKVKLYEDVKVQSLFPHMHVRGRAFEYRATYPTGESQVLLSVPHYDFNWQLTYDLAEPVTLPKGTELEAVAWYDNSPNNPANPNPRTDVWWGEQTWEEMLAGFMDFAIPVSMDPALIARPVKKQVASN